MYTYGYLLYLPITIIFSLLFIINGCISKRPLGYYVMALLAVIYINKAIELAFFPFLIADISEFTIYNNINFKINLISLNKIQLIGNIALTIPIGIGIQYLVNSKFIGRLFLSIALALSFELIQLILLFTLKPIDIFFDVNDIICNVTGAILGLFIACAINKLLSNIPLKSNRGLFSYIHQVCINCSNNKNSLNDIYRSKAS